VSILMENGIKLIKKFPVI